LWWWPAVFAVLALAGMVGLWVTIDTLFAFMSVESASSYMLVSAALLICLYISATAATMMRWIRRRESRRHELRLVVDEARFETAA
jgi:glucan phosphoethanolaminetransferase (alkaline phosphatase superfamily)